MKFTPVQKILNQHCRRCLWNLEGLHVSRPLNTLRLQEVAQIQTQNIFWLAVFFIVVAFVEVVLSVIVSFVVVQILVSAICFDKGQEFAQNGAIVRIKGKVKNVMTIQQWGTPFTITEIELITPGNKVNDSEM